jgi:chromosome partitioning protein
MAKIISFFNHKGGVSKTTTAYHVAWMLSDKGYKVLMVDTDSQCNLTGLSCSYDGKSQWMSSAIIYCVVIHNA